MTDRNELERLLAAATEGSFSGIYKNYNVRGNMRAIVNGDRYPIAFVPAWDAPEDGEIEASSEGEANAALICFLRNNAQHYLSLMDEVERLREALGRIASRDLLEVERYYERTWCIPETGNEYTSREPVFKRSSYQNAEEFQAIARQALTEWRDQ